MNKCSGKPEEQWKLRGWCIGFDPDWWMNGASDNEIDFARSICQSCEVRTECLEHALENKEKFGMWGGLTARERRRLRRRRKLTNFLNTVKYRWFI